MKGGNQWKIWNLKIKSGINQNAENWVLIDKSIKMLKFEWKGNNQSKCWNLSVNVGIDQILKFERKRADLSNVEIYCKGGHQTTFWNGCKGELKVLEFKWKVRNQSKCWNLGVKGRLIKLFKFECQMSNWSKCWNLSEKPEIDQMLIFYCKSGNRSKNLEFD